MNLAVNRRLDVVFCTLCQGLVKRRGAEKHLRLHNVTFDKQILDTVFPSLSRKNGTILPERSPALRALHTIQRIRGRKVHVGFACKECYWFGRTTTNHRHDGRNPSFSPAYLQNCNAANSKSLNYIGVQFPGPADRPSQARKLEEEELEWWKWKAFHDKDVRSVWMENLGVGFQNLREYMNWLRGSNGGVSKQGSLIVWLTEHCG
jgi:hypothetical protein